MELFFNNKEYKQLKKQYERTCFKLIGKYCINTGDKLIEKSAAETHEYFKNKKITLEIVETQTTKKGTTTSTTKEITKNFYQVWSEDPEMKEYLEIVFNCDMSKVLPTQYNLFEGFEHLNKIKVENKIDLSPIFEHIRSLVNYDEEHFKYVISWLAQLVQQPHILPHTTLIFISDEGVGKDLFSKFISDVINDKYTHNTEKLENICGKFNSILGGKLLITINETNPVESRERIENIKFVITADKVTIEGKHKDPIKTDNFCRFIFFSNRLFAFPVEENSRRPIIFKASNKYLPSNYGIEENKKYFTNLAENIYKNKQYQKAFLDYLKSYDISNFNPKNIVKSELHQELEENSISPIVHFLAHIVKLYNKTFRLSTTDCLKHYIEFIREQNYKFEMTQAKFNVEMVSTYKIKKIKSNGNMFFEFNINEIKDMLIKKYKFNFDKDDEETIDELIEPNYKKMFEDAQKEIEELKKILLEQKEETIKYVENPMNKKVETPQVKVNKHIKTESIVETEDLEELENLFKKSIE